MYCMWGMNPSPLVTLRPHCIVFSLILYTMNSHFGTVKATYRTDELWNLKSFNAQTPCQFPSIFWALANLANKFSWFEFVLSSILSTTSTRRSPKQVLSLNNMAKKSSSKTSTSKTKASSSTSSKAAANQSQLPFRASTRSSVTKTSQPQVIDSNSESHHETDEDKRSSVLGDTEDEDSQSSESDAAASDGKRKKGSGKKKPKSSKRKKSVGLTFSPLYCPAVPLLQSHMTLIIFPNL